MQPRHIHPLKRQYLLTAASLFPMVIGCLTLLGWAFHWEALKSIRPGYATMKPFTAVAFILMGACLWLFIDWGGVLGGRPSSPRLARLLALLVMLLGLDSVIEAMGWVGSGFNEILFHRALLDTGLPHPGQMSSITGWCFVILGLSIVLLDLESRKGFRPSEYLALFVLISGYLGLAGYVYGVAPLYHSVPFSSLALHTALAFIVTAGGALILRPDRGLMSVVMSNQAGGWMARRILPITSSIPFIIGWSRIHGERAGLYPREMGMAVFTMANISVMAVVVWANARFLNRVDFERDQREKEAKWAARKLHSSNEELQAEVIRRKEAQESLRVANNTLEAKVLERTEKLLAANGELEAFSYSVSHDLRTPLRALDAFGKLLLESSGPKLSPEERGYLDRICFNSRRMDALIDDLLDFSRVARGNLARAEVNLSEIAEQILDDLKKSQPARRVETVVALGLQVMGDENLLHMALENLLGNAWKFTGKKNAARIEFGCQKSGEGRVFFVRDNGIGFDMAEAGHLFESFQRLHRANEFEGNGIGLATVQRILRRHEGSIRAEAKIGEGATFFFTFPEK